MSEVNWDEYARKYRQLERDSHLPALLVEYLAARAGTAIDVGCGEGDLLDRIAQSYPLWDVSGFEISSFRADIARGRGHRVTDDPDGRVPTGQFDLAISCHVIEHVADDGRHASQLASLVRPGGAVYVETPLRLPGSWYFRRSPTAGWVLDPTHIREYRSVDELCAVIESVGLRVVSQDVVPLSFPLGAASALARRILRLPSLKHSSGRGLASLAVPIPRYRVMGVLAVKDPRG